MIHRPSIERPIRRAVTGVLLLDKPLGLSSNHALQRVRRLYRAAKAGHTGTLDPLATGLLPLCLGEATKYAGWVLEAPKSYQATLCLGMTSDTGDGEGILTPGSPFEGGAEQLQQIVKGFMGPRQQTPPMHSALKVQGKTLYQLARQGETVARAPRAVHIHDLHIQDWQGERLVIEVTVSKGTYIRVLAEEMGVALGCGAYLSQLRRMATGAFRLEQAVTLETLEQLSEYERDALLRPADQLLAGIPEQVLEVSEAQALSQGRTIPRKNPWPAGLCRLYDSQRRFYGLGQIDEVHETVVPVRMMGERENR